MSSSTATRSNLGPLTTTFTYPNSCTVVVRGCSDCDSGWQAQSCSTNPNNLQGVQDNPDCWPSRDTTNFDITTGYALNGWGFYSPGVVCPAGYTAACSSTGSVVGNGFSFQFDIEQSETAVGCCPTGFYCGRDGEDGAQTCYSLAKTGSVAVVSCSNGNSNGFSYLEVPTTQSDIVSSEVITEKVTKVDEFATNPISTETELFTSYVSGVVTISTFRIQAPLFQLVHQASDVPASASTASIASETAKPTTTGTPSSGLSTGAKAGIGVGVSLGALILIGVAAFFFLRRRRGAPPAAAPVTNEPKTELPGQFVHPAELPEGTSPRVPPSELQG